MAKYQVAGWASISVWAEVEADSEQEAANKFMELQAPSLCHQCSDAGGDGDTFQLNGFDDNSNITEINGEEVSAAKLKRWGFKS